MKAVVLAGGEGRRLQGLADKLAKPMVTVLNKPLLEHTLCQLERAGVRDAHLNLYHRPESIIEFLKRRQGLLRYHTRIEPRLTGPAGGAALFLPELSGEDCVLVMSGDACQNVDLEAFVQPQVLLRQSLPAKPCAELGVRQAGGLHHRCQLLLRCPVTLGFGCSSSLTAAALPADFSQSDSVGCATPVSFDSALAETLPGPTIRWTIRCLKLSEYCLCFTVRLPDRPLDHPASRGDNFPETGGCRRAVLPRMMRAVPPSDSKTTYA